MGFKISLGHHWVNSISADDDDAADDDVVDDDDDRDGDCDGHRRGCLSKPVEPSQEARNI